MAWSRRFNICTLVSSPIAAPFNLVPQRGAQTPCGTLFPRGSRPCAFKIGLGITLRVAYCDGY